MSGSSPLILVIDDDKLVREGARDALEYAGFSVLIADDGRTGVQTFAERPDEIALVLLDLTMPEMSGGEALEELLKIRPDACVVVMSGYDEAEVKQRFTLQSPSGFLRKPFNMRGLLAKVDEVLGRE